MISVDDNQESGPPSAELTVLGGVRTAVQCCPPRASENIRAACQYPIGLGHLGSRSSIQS